MPIVGKHYVASSGTKYPARYFLGLTKEQQVTRERELIAREKALASGKKPKFPAASDVAVVTKPSKWTEMFHKHYGKDMGFNKQAFVRRFHIPKKVLDAVYDRGLKAWATSGSRPGANAISWARARIYKFILIQDGKAAIKVNDPDADQHRVASA